MNVVGVYLCACVWVRLCLHLLLAFIGIYFWYSLSAPLNGLATQQGGLVLWVVLLVWPDFAFMKLPQKKLIPRIGYIS